MKVNEILEQIDAIVSDASISKGVRESLIMVRARIQQSHKDAIDVEIDAALQIIEELSLNPNLSTYTRTQIWNLTSMLETVSSSR